MSNVNYEKRLTLYNEANCMHLFIYLLLASTDTINKYLLSSIPGIFLDVGDTVKNK